ncbi:MAG: hypothetical protein ACK5VE_04685 [Alphaproteobacteria bacterium]
MFRRITGYLRAETEEPSFPTLAIHRLEPGAGLVFASNTPLQDLAGKKARVAGILTYHFGETRTFSYQIMTESGAPRLLTVAEDADGYYLGISRPLTAEEQHRWFDRDALSFFTEPSSAKTLKCRVNEADYPGWTAPKFIKSIDWLEGSVAEGRQAQKEGNRKSQSVQYSLLVSEAGDKAVEIERYPETGMLRVYVTVYRPAGDIAQILETIPDIPAPPVFFAQGKVANAVTGSAPILSAATLPPVIEKPVITPATTPHVALPTAPKAVPIKPDFRRISREELPAVKPESEPETPPLPAFLTREKRSSRRSHFLVLDEIIPPEIERVRCDMPTAKLLIDASIARGVRVRDLLRQMTGLNAPAHDEVLFEMPLSDEDYMQLAQRYQLKPDRKSELRQRLMEEIQIKLNHMSA